MRLRDVLMCSDLYALLIWFLLPKTQLPPTVSDASKQTNGTPRSCSALATAMPEEPAPMRATYGSSWVMRATLTKMTPASSLVRQGVRYVVTSTPPSPTSGAAPPHATRRPAARPRRPRPRACHLIRGQVRQVLRRLCPRHHPVGPARRRADPDRSRH